MKDKIVIIGGGTISHIKSHLALCAPAYGTTAKRIVDILKEVDHDYDIELILTRMAGGGPLVETNEDVARITRNLIKSKSTKIIFFNCALVDFNAVIANRGDETLTGKYAGRLNSKLDNYYLKLNPEEKIIQEIREERKDIYLVGFKTTCGEEDLELQYYSGTTLLKGSSCNLVLANDTKTRVNMIITPEESVQLATTDRDRALKEICEIALMRSRLNFTPTEVEAGQKVKWDDKSIPDKFRTVIDYCIDNGAYKMNPNGVTVGHFAYKKFENHFLMSRRKCNFNIMKRCGVIKVKLEGTNKVIATGYKPSAGARSQIKVFEKHKDMNCIVHFHCPLKEDHVDDIQINDQRPYECGSLECGLNTVNSLKKFGNIYAGMLDKHGPNIVWNVDTDPQEVIDFIERNFDLSMKTNFIKLS